MKRYFLLNEKEHVNLFNKRYREIKRRNNQYTKTQLMIEYCTRSNALFKMNGTQMADERTKITKQRIIQLQTNNYHSEYDIPDNFAETNQEDWIGAYVTSVQQVYLELDRIAVVKRIDSDETIHTTKVHEPFRNVLHRDTDILYKWSCLCKVCLDKGFCSHIFFCEHHCNQTKIPESVCSKALSGTINDFFI